MSNEAIVKALGDLQAGRVGNAMQILREALAEQPAPVQGWKLVPIDTPDSLARRLYQRHPYYRGTVPFAWEDAPESVRLEWLETASKQLATPQPAPVQQEPVASAAKCAIMGAAYDFRDAHLSGSTNLKRSAHAALESAVDAALAEQPAPVLSAGPITPEMKNWSEGDKAELISVITQHMAPQPAQRKPLTRGQKQRLWSGVGDKPTLKDRVNAYGLAIEAAHNIKVAA